MRISDWSSDVCSSDLRLEDQWAGENEIPDEVAARIQAIDEEIAPLVSKPLIYDAAEVAIAGAFVSIDVDGSLHVERGFVRPEDEPAEVADDAEPAADEGDRKSVVEGKRVAVRVDLGGRRTIKKNNK